MVCLGPHGGAEIVAIDTDVRKSTPSGYAFAGLQVADWSGQTNPGTRLGHEDRPDDN